MTFKEKWCGNLNINGHDNEGWCFLEYVLKQYKIHTLSGFSTELCGVQGKQYTLNKMGLSDTSSCLLCMAISEEPLLHLFFLPKITAAMAPTRRHNSANN